MADSNSIYLLINLFNVPLQIQHIDIVHRYCWFLRGPRSPRQKKAILKPDEMMKIRLANELAWFLRRNIGRLRKNMPITRLSETESRFHTLKIC